MYLNIENFIDWVEVFHFKEYFNIVFDNVY